MNGIYHGDDTLSVGRPSHLGSSEVDAEVNADRTEEISDACAVTIASWWAGPRRGDGLAMAELATSGRVQLESLADDLSRAFDATELRPSARRALDLLATWALNHPSRQAG